jgi:hypothetical protein
VATSAFAQKNKGDKYKKTRIKTEIATLPTVYNPVPETMPFVSMPNQLTVYCIENNIGCQLGSAKTSLWAIECTGLEIRERGPYVPWHPFSDIMLVNSSLSPKYSGIPEDDNWRK